MRRPRCSWVRRPLNEGRGINPGDTTAFSVRGNPRKPLNEGRGINPGDTVRVQASRLNVNYRSTKAGASTPATRESACRTGSRGNSLNEGRGINPGDTFHLMTWPSPGVPSLNEGRGINPGDT